MRNILVLITLTLCGSVAEAQYSETINSDLPGQSISANTVGARVLQFQANALYGEAGRSIIDYDGMAAEFVLRYGVWEKVELSAGIGYSLLKPKKYGFVQSLDEGLRLFGIAARSNLYHGEGAVPSVGMEAKVILRERKFSGDRSIAVPVLTLMSVQEFGSVANLTLNVGGSWDEIAMLHYAVNVGLNISRHVSFFLEHFGLYYHDVYTDGYYYSGLDYREMKEWIGRVNSGFAFLIGDNFQLDASGGYEFNPMNTRRRSYFSSGGEWREWYLGLGLSWRARFKKKEKK